MSNGVLKLNVDKIVILMRKEFGKERKANAMLLFNQEAVQRLGDCFDNCQISKATVLKLE